MTFFLAAVVLFCSSSAFAVPALTLDGRSQLTDGLLHDSPSSNSYAATMDQLLPQTVYLLEENGGFSEFDIPLVSIYGDSWVWNRWYIDGVDLGDPVFPGAPLVRLPFRGARALQVYDAGQPSRSGERGIAVLSLLEEPAVRAVGAQYSLGHVGDIWPPARAIMDFSSGAHSRNRNARPTSLRRHMLHPVVLYGVSTHQTERLTVGQAAELRYGQRRWVDFRAIENLDALQSPAIGQYDERVMRASGAVKLVHGKSGRRATILVDALDRDHYGAEIYRQRQETGRLQTLAVATILQTREFHLAPFFKLYEYSPVDLAFSKDLLDPDGQELAPFTTPGRTVAVGATGEFRRRSFYVRGRQSVTVHRPGTHAWDNTLTFAGADYGFYRWHAENSVQAISDLRLGTSSEIAPRKMIFAYDAYLAGMAGASGGGNSIGFVDLGTALHLTFVGPDRITPFVRLGKAPIGVDSQLVRLLDPGYLNGELFLTGQVLPVLYETVGGSSIRVGDRLKPANVYDFATGFEGAFHTYWQYRIHGMLKLFHNTYEVQFDGDPAGYGETVDGVFFHTPGPSAYLLENRRNNLPVYYGLHMQLLGQRSEHYLFSWSFSAYNAIGRSAFGNGPTANDIGVVDFSSANPNSRVRGNANLDADRAFNTKILTGTPIYRGLWWYATVTHYDGTPFAPYDIHEHAGQVARTYNQYRGSPGTLIGPLKGAREDYRLNLDLKLQYRVVLARVSIRAWWLMANLLDFGNEISELQSTAGLAGRLALEQEIPRSFEFGVEFADF